MTLERVRSGNENKKWNGMMKMKIGEIIVLFIFAIFIYMLMAEKMTDF